MMADSSITISGSVITIQNSLVKRVLKKENEVWRSQFICRHDGSDNILVNSDEFRISLTDDIELTLDDYRAEGMPVVREDGGSKVVKIAYTPRDFIHHGMPRSIIVRYSLDETPYLRKTMELELDSEGVVTKLEVERFKSPLVCDLGGIGQPIFIGNSWFTGLEYPGGDALHSNGLVTLAHYPGRAKRHFERDSRWYIESKTAVLGSGKEGDTIELVFSDYLETIRRPSPKHLLANTWVVDSDPSSPTNGFGVKEYIDYYNIFNNNLNVYGVQLDSLQPDYCKFDPKSLSMPNKKFFPQGYASLRKHLEQHGSSLSLWLSLNGACATDHEWLHNQGYEKANGPFDTFYCISAPKFNAAIRNTLKKTIEDGNISYFKHDFVQMLCSTNGHGHLPTFRHGFEANLDATLELIEFERQIKPNILNAPTSYSWLSPWWLMHTNYIYMGISDYGRVSVSPQPSYRDWETTYRDDHFFKIYNKWQIPMPMSSMITHTFLPYAIGLHDTNCHTESLREWSDLNAMVFGRGLRLIDIYIDGRDLAPEFWKVIGEFSRWHQENLDILGVTKMVGGRPQDGQAYGYIHWKDDNGILCLRNPDVAEQAIRIPFDKSVFYRGPDGNKFRGRIIYPYVENLPDQFTSGDHMLFNVPGYTTMLIELHPGKPQNVEQSQPTKDIYGTGYATPEDRDWTNVYDGYPSMVLDAKISVKIPDENMARCDLYLITRSNGALPDFPTISLNGSSSNVKFIEGSRNMPTFVSSSYSQGGGDIHPPRDTETLRWAIRVIDLNQLRGKTANLTVKSSANPVPFILDAWVVVDRPVEMPKIKNEVLPPQLWNNFRRQSVPLLSYNLSITPLHH